MSPISASYSPEHLPSLPGTYALLLRLDHTTRVQVGALGMFHFPRGWYIYVGSARGAGGLGARLRHHWRIALRAHWHLDFLRSVARPTEIWWQIGAAKRECQWAQALGCDKAAVVPAKGFGASDCDCISHLFHFRLHTDACSFRYPLANSQSASFQHDLRNRPFLPNWGLENRSL